MYRIGVDIGGTSIKAGVVADGGKILYKLMKTTMKGDESAFIRGIVEIIEDVMKKVKITYQDIEFIGVGCPGIVDAQKGVIINAGNLGLSNFPLKEHLENLLLAPILIANDANCAALGEYNYIGDSNIDSFLMLTLGTGIGGGIILGRKIYEGCDGSAGEFGNMVIYVDGRRAWWEEYASAQALVKMAQRVAIKHKDSLLYTLARNDSNNINGEIIFAALEQKDEFAEAIFKEYIKYLGDGIIGLLYIFRPEVLTIGGGISQAAPLWAPLMEYIAANSNWNRRERKTRICKAMLGNDAGIIGAAYLKEFIQ